MNYVVTQAIEAMGDVGVAVDIQRLCHFSERKQEVQQKHQRLSHLADFLTTKWQHHYEEEKRLRAQKEATIKRLIAAQVTKQMEPFIHYNNKHAYLS